MKLGMGADPRVIVPVQCSPGHRGEEVPCAFFLGECRIEVAEIFDRWPGRDHRCFKVRGSDGGRYMMRHDTASGAWEVTPFEGMKRGDPSGVPRCESRA